MKTMNKQNASKQAADINLYRMKSHYSQTYKDRDTC